MRRMILFLLIVLCFSPATTVCAAYLDIPVQGIGDGYWHNEVGRRYDFFDANSNQVSAKYVYFGSSSTLRNDTGFTQFSLANAPDIDDVVTVTLNIYIESAWKTGSTTDSGNIKHAQNASSANGQASQRISGSELVAIISPTDNGWLSFDVTQYVLNDLNNNYAWSVFSYHPNTSGDYSNRNAGFIFTSAEGGKPAYLRFETSPVPLPSTLFLLGSGLMASLWRKKGKTT